MECKIGQPLQKTFLPFLKSLKFLFIDLREKQSFVVLLVDAFVGCPCMRPNMGIEPTTLAFWDSTPTKWPRPFPQKFKHKVTLWPSSSTPTYDTPKRNEHVWSHKNFCMNAHGSLVHESQKVKPPRYPPTGEWVNDMWPVSPTEHYSSIKKEWRDEPWAHTLRERSQSPRTTRSVIHSYKRSNPGKQRDRKCISVCSGLGQAGTWGLIVLTVTQFCEYANHQLYTLNGCIGGYVNYTLIKLLPKKSNN